MCVEDIACNISVIFWDTVYLNIKSNEKLTRYFINVTVTVTRYFQCCVDYLVMVQLIDLKIANYFSKLYFNKCAQLFSELWSNYNLYKLLLEL